MLLAWTRTTVSNFTCEPANWLKTVVQGTNSYAFACNGLGDRLQQTVNGTPTRYVLDPAAGLTQVLSDGTNSYLYGNDRLGQYQAAMQYFGADGLGSVRQIFDASAIVVGSTRYDPYGNVMSHSGATSVFAFAGEQYDATGLTYLRARYYSAAQGRFTTRDPWEGNYALPGTLDHWVYVRNNPVNFLDPSGLIDESQATAAKNIRDYLLATYLVDIIQDWGAYTLNLPSTPHTPAMTRQCWDPGDWKLHDLELVRDAIDRMAGGSGLGNPGKFMQAMKGKVYISRWNTDTVRSMAPPPPLNLTWGDVVLANGAFPGNNEPYTTYTVIHELGHVWDHRSDHQLSFGMMQALNTWIYDLALQSFIWDPYANPELPAGADRRCTVDDYKRKTPGCENEPYAFTYGAGSLLEGPGWEDWAESFASFVYRDYHQDPTTNLGQSPTRENYVRRQIANIR